MAFDLSLLKFIGPALPEPFVKFDLEKVLNQNNLLLKTTGEEGRKLQASWDAYRRKIRELGVNSGPIRVRNHIIEPLLGLLGYSAIIDSEKIVTREGTEDAGFLLEGQDKKSRLRVWTVASGMDLEAPYKRGYAYRFSYVRIAQRVLLTTQERVGLLTDGQELRILISDSVRPDSQVCISVDPDWKNSREVPDSFRFLLALCSPKGIEALPDIIDKARLKQATVTKELRIQARQAIEHFVQQILNDSKNKAVLDTYPDKAILAKELWHEGLILVYRLLFVLKGEASDDPAKSFGFTGSSIWRRTYSPTVSLSSFVRSLLDDGQDTGNLLEAGLRTIFKMFAQGVKSTELNITPLGGTLFGENSTPLLSKLHWPEKACAMMLDKLLWTLSERRGGPTSRQRIHYGALDIEDLGRVYEALLELEPGIAEEKMCRLKRSKLEVVVPYAQGEKYKSNTSVETEEETEEEEEEGEGENKKSTTIQWIEEINPGKFYLRVGLGRKSTGSYYTPHSFVRFLVQETLGPKIEECSPKDNPYPNKILQIKVLDPAMGSGHFLVEACRFMAERLYESGRLCDEKALDFERKIEKEQDVQKKIELKQQADAWRNRIIEIPDPQDEILKYLPSSAPGGETTGLSQKKAEGLCKRLVAVHCLYGVDKNVLAVELAKLSLWLESQSEGFPLTFLNHRLVVGDSITGPFFEHLLKYPGSQESLDDVFNKSLKEKLTQALSNVLSEVKELEKSVGIDLTDITNKERAKERLETALLPFKILAAAWVGGVMSGPEECDDMAYVQLARAISETGRLPDNIESPKLLKMIAKGLSIEEQSLSLAVILQKITEEQVIPALPYDLTFPEVFFELTDPSFTKKGFDVVLGNPPWDKVMPATKEFFVQYDFEIIAAKNKAERSKRETSLLENLIIKKQLETYWLGFELYKKIIDRLTNWQNVEIEGQFSGAQPDSYRYFCERGFNLLKSEGFFGMVLPSGFHANEGATGVRKLFLQQMALKYCYSYENKKKLFEIHSSFKFALVVAQKNFQGTGEFLCAFYLHDEEWLFQEDTARKIKYGCEFVKMAGGKYLSFVELRSRLDYLILEACFKTSALTVEKFLESISVVCGEELNKTRQSKYFRRISDVISFNSWSDLLGNKLEGFIVYEGKNIWQFSDQFENICEFYFPFEHVTGRPDLIKLTPFYRFGYRLIAGSTNERTLVAAILCPRSVCTQSVSIERNVDKRCNADLLLLVAYWNAFIVDWLGRMKVGAAVNKFLLEEIPVPKLNPIRIFLSHQAIRLVCNHIGFQSLWHEQLGDNWREPNKKPFTWPVLITEEERWEVRSAIDAVLVDAYGLNRDQYDHVLHSFDRASGPNPYTGICLVKFDELKQTGLDAFTKKYDPYWNVPLNENLPKPVINLAIPQKEGEKDMFGNVIVAKARGRRKKR